MWVLLVVVAVGAIVIPLTFIWQARKKSSLQSALKQRGFNIDRFFFFDKGFLAINVAEKQIALGYSENDIVILPYADIISFRFSDATSNPSNKQKIFSVVTRNVTHPTYNIRLSNHATAQSCFDAMQAAIG